MEFNFDKVEVRVTQKEYEQILSRYGFLFEQSLPLRGITFGRPITNLADKTFNLLYAIRYAVGF